MTVFWKTDLKNANTEVHFLPVDESHTESVDSETRGPRTTEGTKERGHNLYIRRFIIKLFGQLPLSKTT